MPAYEIARNEFIVVQNMDDPSLPTTTVSYESFSAPIELRNQDKVWLRMQVLAANLPSGMELLNVYLRQSNELWNWETGDPTNPTDANPLLFQVAGTGVYEGGLAGIGARFVRLHYLFRTDNPDPMSPTPVGTSITFDATLSVSRSS